MTTEIEAKLREIKADKKFCDCDHCQNIQAKLVQALRRAMNTLVYYKDSKYEGVHPAECSLADIAGILSAPNDKEGE